MGLLDLLLGKRLASDEEEEHKVSALEGVPMLGLDALGSSSYGPEAALTLLIPLGALGLVYLGPVIAVIIAILVVLYFSYRQTIEAYPTGGGSYTVAKENLGERFGLLAASALLLDYILNVAVGVSAGVAALVSAVPSLQSYILPLCLGILALVALVNLRGVRESGVAWSLPTYSFVVCMGIVLIIGIAKTVMSGGHPRPVAAPPPLHPAIEGVSLWLLLRAFAGGCTAMTGVEAVSNGVSAFAEPAVPRAQRTLTVIVGILGLLLAGIAWLARAYHIGAMPQDEPGYQSIISQLVGAAVGHGWFYYVTLGSVLSVLCLSANTSFTGFPRLCRLIAEDDFLPHAFANKGRRLVYTLGIAILSILAGLLLIAFGGITDRLIPLFAVGAFLAFTLSQAGMVVHWRRDRSRHARTNMLINGAGALATGAALVVILIAKFRDGAWVTVLIVPALLTLFWRVKRHYERIERETAAPEPIDLSGLEPPLVVIPTSGWNTVTEKALRFALRLSPDLIAVHVSTGEDDERSLRGCWAKYVSEPLREASLPVPQLVTVPSPYRHLVTPLLRYLRKLERDHPDRQLAIIIPELVEGQWWAHLLHNQRAAILKAALLFHGDRRMVVISVPWYVEQPASVPAAAPTRPLERSAQS